MLCKTSTSPGNIVFSVEGYRGQNLLRFERHARGGERRPPSKSRMQCSWLDHGFPNRMTSLYSPSNGVCVALTVKTLILYLRRPYLFGATHAGVGD